MNLLNQAALSPPRDELADLSAAARALAYWGIPLDLEPLLRRIRVLTAERPMDEHGNRLRKEGCDRCLCGCKYWENDRCIDCGGTEVQTEES